MPPACTLPGTTPNSRAAKLPFQRSSYLPAKACCLESSLLPPSKWIPKKQSPEFRVHDVVGDGRCGYCALAHYLGVSCAYVMQHVARSMAAAGTFSAADVFHLLAACDLRVPCPRSAWLSSAHLQLLATSMPCSFPSGILVRLFQDSASSPEWVWFQCHTSQPRHLQGKCVTALLGRGVQPCMLGHIQRPCPHFFALSARGARVTQTELTRAQSYAHSSVLRQASTSPMIAPTGVIESLRVGLADAARSRHAQRLFDKCEDVFWTWEWELRVAPVTHCHVQLASPMKRWCHMMRSHLRGVVGALHVSSLLQGVPSVSKLHAAIGLQGGALPQRPRWADVFDDDSDNESNIFRRALRDDSELRLATWVQVASRAEQLYLPLGRAGRVLHADMLSATQSAVWFCSRASPSGRGGSWLQMSIVCRPQLRQK